MDRWSDAFNDTIAVADPNVKSGAYQIYAMKSWNAAEREPVETGSSPLLRWWDAYPTIKSTIPTVTADQLASFIRDETKLPSKDYAVIDVRRNDHEGGHVRGSYQWAAQTFYDDLPAFYEKFKETKEVIFYCQSSNGRGPRCAAWYQDYLNELHAKEGIEIASSALVLKGGIKNWLAKFGEDSKLVDRD